MNSNKFPNFNLIAYDAPWANCVISKHIAILSIIEFFRGIAGLVSRNSIDYFFSSKLSTKSCREFVFKTAN